MNRLFTFILTLLVSLQLATAATAEWMVERVSSSVWASQDGTNWRDVEVGESFSSETWIQTGERGQVIFARGVERIVFRPMTIATLESSGNRTDVGPIGGSVLLSIDPNRGGRTVVTTPHLAAVVLGTVLEVSTSEETSSVRVDVGRVRVEHGGRRAVLERGQEGTVQADTTRDINIQAARVSSLTPQGSGFGLVFGAPEALPESATRNSTGSGNTGSAAGNNGNGNGSNGNGNGNGNNGNGNGNGNNGNGGNGNGNNGNAFGNSGNGNGKGNNGNGNGNGGSNNNNDDDD